MADKDMSVSEVAKHLETTKRMVWYWIQTERIRARKIGNWNYAINRRDLEGISDQDWYRRHRERARAKV